MKKILVIEDEVKTAASLKQGLTEHGFFIEIAENGKKALEIIDKTHFDLIISDVMMPVMDGVSFTKVLRHKDVACPILMLTALTSIDDKANAYEAGADDYLPKPFLFQELLMKIKAMLRRTSPDQEPQSLVFADLNLDFLKKKAYRQGIQIDLTAKEFALLAYFMQHPNRVISKTEIAEKVWDINFDTGTNIIEVYVNYVRNKIDKNFEPKLLHTERGMGYILKT